MSQASLSNLTPSGWVLFTLWAYIMLLFVASIAKPDKDDKWSDVRDRAFVVAILTAWLAWLVTP